MHGIPCLIALALLALLSGCIGGNGTNPAAAPSPPTANVLTLTVDSGPSAATGQINHAYVTVKVCAPGSQSCANIDHVLLDTGSNGLRLVASVLVSYSLALPNQADTRGNVIEECVSFTGGQTWGPVRSADVFLAGEKALNVPVQVMNDTNTGAAPPATCGARLWSGVRRRRQPAAGLLRLRRGRCLQRRKRRVGPAGRQRGRAICRR